ncbi:MAG: outer membrane protein transport protein, partial [Planctomycetota bacterium]
MTFVSLQRTRDVGGSLFESPDAFFDMSGWSFAGVRVGMQYQVFDHLSFGATYRHKTRTEIDGAGAIINTGPDDRTNDWTGEFTLPSRFIFGLRTDIGPFGFALDAEYALQDQNPNSALESPGALAPVTQRYEWDNAWTVRLGAEYRLFNGKLPIRAGYIWDAQTTNPNTVSAFGTPPAPTHIATIGTGWNEGPWQLNVAYSFRTGSATVAEDQLGSRSALDEEGCSSCGFQGTYDVTSHTLHFDFSYHFGRGETRESGGDGRLGHGVIYGPEEGTVEPEPAPAPEPGSDEAVAGERESGGNDTGEGDGRPDVGSSAAPGPKPAAAVPNPKPTTFVGEDVQVRYVDQVITTELNRLVVELLKELLRFQPRARPKDPPKPK